MRSSDPNPLSVALPRKQAVSGRSGFAIHPVVVGNAARETLMVQICDEALDLVCGAGPFGEGDSVKVGVKIGRTGVEVNADLTIGRDSLNRMFDAVQDFFFETPQPVFSAIAEPPVFSAVATRSRN